MKNLSEALEYESVILRREMSKTKWYEGYYTQTNASKMKSRLEDGTLHRNTIKDLMKHFGYEKVVDPVEAMYRKIEDRRFEVKEEGRLLGIYTAKTKEEALKAASIEKYGDTGTHKDHKGRERLIWELSLCDMTAEEVE